MTLWRSRRGHVKPLVYRRLMKYVATVNPAYRFYKLFPDGVREVPKYDHTLDNFKTQNWAIIKTDA